HRELDGGRHHVAVGSEDLSQQSAAEGGPVDPLPGRSEQHLLDQIADVRLFVGRRRPPQAVDLEGKLDLHHVPFTRIWPAITVGGPCGICSALWQSAWLV